MEKTGLEHALFQLAIGNSKAALALIQGGHASDPRATAVLAQTMINLGQYQKVVELLESAGDDLYAKLLFAKALFLNQEHERALIEAQKLKERLETAKLDEVELGDMRGQVGLLLRKVQLELSNKNRIGNINDAAYLSGKTPASASAAVKEEAKASIDRKYDWY